MASVKVTVRNKDRLFRKLRDLAPEIQKELGEANAKSAHEMVAIAQSLVPVSTGKLRESIVATPPGELPPAYSQGGTNAQASSSWMVSAGNSAVRYGHLVEFGARAHKAGGMFEGADHPGAPAQPFFFPAYRLIRKRMRARASRAINRAVKRIAGK